MPITGKLDGTGQTDGILARVNSFREEPGGSGRVFVHDLTGPLYILDKQSKSLTTYLNFNGRPPRQGQVAGGLFRKLAWEIGWAGGLITFQFDPEYLSNGRFYTVHLEDPAVDAPAVPDNTSVPAFDTTGYTVTAPIATPGPITREGVVIEWTDRNRIERHVRRHRARAAAAAIEHASSPARRHRLQSCRPARRRRLARDVYRQRRQRLGRIAASRHARPTRSGSTRSSGRSCASFRASTITQAASTVSDNGRYRIPNDNPFVSIAGARKEIWALGFRNPHRLHFAIDPSNAKNNRLIANSVGMRTWETINIVHRGANYGYSAARRQRGHEVRQLDGETSGGRSHSAADHRHRGTRADHAHLSSAAVSAQARRRRRDRRRLSVSRQEHPGACAASTSSPTSPPDVSGTPTTRRC